MSVEEFRPIQVYGEQPDPAGGVYAIVSRDEVVYVGRSRNVRRRIAFLLGPHGPFGDDRGFGATWIVGTDDLREQRVLEQQALVTYGRNE